MFKLIAFALLAFVSLSALAKPSCLIVGDCIEYNGRIIDMRSPTAKMYQDSKGCDALKENCMLPKKVSYDMPILSESEFKRIVGEDGAEYFIPIDVRKEDLMLLAGALSLGVVVFANDGAIMDFVQNNKVEEMQPLVDIANFSGGREGMIAVAAGSYFIGAVMKNGKMKQVGLFAIGAGLATQAVTELFKVSFGRIRPNTAETPYDFFEDGKSFFSGHSSAAFSLATVIAEVYKDKPVVPYLAYGAAAIVAYARMHDKKHWGSDVLAGAVAGTLVTKIFMRAFDKDDSRIPSGLMVIPEYGRDYAGNPRYGVTVHWKPAEKKGVSKCSRSGLQGEALVRACFEEHLNN